MPVNLSRGQKINFSNDMNYAVVGLGWKPNEFDTGAEFDLDVQAFLLGADGKVINESDLVFYGNLQARNGAVKLMGDDRSGGKSDGDDEQIYVNFTKIPDEVDRIAITVTIYDYEARKQNFGQVSDSYVRVVKLKNENDTDGETVIHFDLGEEFSIETAIVVCEIYRKDGTWKFNALAQGYAGGLAALCNAYGVAVI